MTPIAAISALIVILIIALFIMRKLFQWYIGTNEIIGELRIMNQHLKQVNKTLKNIKNGNDKEIQSECETM